MHKLPLYLLVLRGVLMYVQSQCGKETPKFEYPDSGWISSPNYPNEYPNESECSWKFKKHKNTILVFDIEEIDFSSAELEIDGHEVPLDSKDACYTYRYKKRDDLCKNLQVTKYNQCETAYFDSSSVTVSFESEKNNCNNRGFNITYLYIDCLQDFVTTSTATSTTSAVTSTHVETTSVSRAKTSFSPPPETSKILLTNFRTVTSHGNTTPASDRSSNQPGHNNILWIAIGAGILIATTGFVFVIFILRRKKKSRSQQPSNENVYSTGEQGGVVVRVPSSLYAAPYRPQVKVQTNPYDEVQI